MLTPAKAFEIASQWSSLIRNGDPGAVFYTFPLNDARPQSQAHRRQCLDYVESLISEVQARERKDDQERDLGELRGLRVFFTTADLAPDAKDKPQRPNEFHLMTDGANGQWADLDAFTQGYIEALFFTENAPGVSTEEWQATDDHDEGSIPGDVGFADLAPAALKLIIADCQAFQAGEAWQAILEAFNSPEGLPTTEDDPGESDTHGGRDLWYTRNGHGCGFWDGDWPEPYATALDKAAKTFGQVNVYLGDDGKVYLA